MKTMTLYHGSGLVVQKPDVSYGKKSNDYGQGFYCTESEELAGEWACPGEKDGIFNRYRLETDGLRIFRLNGEVDDSYFSFVKDFLNNRISLEQLRQALLENRL